MSHPRKKNISKVPAENQSKSSKTLFMPDTGDLAVLVIETNGAQKKEEKKFNDPHAALSWCQTNAAGFVYFIGVDPKLN